MDTHSNMDLELNRGSKDHRAALNAKPISLEAMALVQRIASMLNANEMATGRRANARREDGFAKLAFAVGAFTFDLLEAAASGGWAFRSLGSDGFVRERVGQALFRSLIAGMIDIDIGLIEAHEDNQIRGSSKRMASSWRATERFLRLMGSGGITPANYLDHFKPGLPTRPVFARMASRREGRNKVRGPKVSLRADAEVLAQEVRIHRINEFIDNYGIEGATHRGFERGFNEYGSEGFAWNKGGRIYSKHQNSYQSKSKSERGMMTIDREPVIEIDIRASYLTILHGISGYSIDVGTDPYAVERLEVPNGDIALKRTAVKMWTVATLGNDGHISRWSTDSIAKYQEKHNRDLSKDFRVADIKKVMCERHPVIQEWGTIGIGWADLMYLESEAMLEAVEALMGHGIPSLSVHDSLIVREKDEGRAFQALRAGYFNQCGIVPYLSIG